jgi:TonB-linked SusC/RagA family outer membrane protein
MKNRLLTMLILMFSTSFIFAQSEVHGVVIEGSMNEPFAFASVYLKGTTVGATTDNNGNYVISVPSDVSNPTLVFQFMGYQTLEVEVKGQEVVNVTLEVDSKQLEEVVVTSFGIKRERKALNYAVQDLGGDDISKTKETNIINSLRGKVAGVQITSSSGSPGASSQILIRGASSVSAGANNQPLYVVDGVIISNAASEGGGNRGMDIDPDDIESMTILKGPAAAALYGWNASNGAIVITTKSGKSGKIRVDFGADFGVSSEVGVPVIQDKYMQGNNGVYDESVSSSWGPLITDDIIKYDNVGGFLGKGILQKYNVSVTGGTKKLSVLASGNYINQTGVVPTEKYQKMGGLFKVDYSFTGKLKIGISTNIIKTTQNRVPYGFMSAMYRWPINRDMSNFEDANGKKVWLINISKKPGESEEAYEERLAKANALENPYWSTKYNPITSDVFRTITTGYISWDAFKGFNLNYRLGYDHTKELFTKVVSHNSAGSSYNGYMRQDTLKRGIINSNLILSYSTALTDKLNIGGLVGQSIEMVDVNSQYYTGTDFIIPGLNEMTNFNNVKHTPSTAKVRNVGLFGSARLDYDDTYFVELTARNDWSSTLSPGMNSFFYPSITVGAIVSEYFSDNLKRTLSYLKLRANYAGVGKATGAEHTRNKLEDYFGIGGGYNYHYLGGNWYIKPELSYSYEFGFETRLWNGKTHLDFTYYNMNSYNQIVTARVSPTSGFVMMTFNAGDITNKGIEIFLNQKIIENDDFTWDLGINYSYNRSLLSNLPDYMSRMVVTQGQVISSAVPSSAVGQPVTGIEGTVYLRNKDGKIVVDKKGLPRIGTYKLDENGDYILNNGKYEIDYQRQFLGDREPDFMLGISNNFTYKNFDFGFLFDIRKGGDVINATASTMTGYGMSESVGNHRNEVILIDAVVEQDGGGFVDNNEDVVVDRTFYSRYNGIGENYVEDGSWIKLRNIRLGYSFNTSKTSFIRKLNLAVTATNVWMWSSYSGGDPETNFGGSGVGGAGTQGLDYFNTPTVRTVSFNLKASF